MPTVMNQVKSLEIRLDSEAPFVSMNICEVGQRQRQERLGVSRQHMNMVQVRTSVTELEEPFRSCT